MTNKPNKTNIFVWNNKKRTLKYPVFVHIVLSRDQKEQMFVFISIRNHHQLKYFYSDYYIRYFILSPEPITSIQKKSYQY